MGIQKDCGVLLPIFSLSGKYGIGTLGKSAYDFIDFLHDSGFSYWEILPLNPTIVDNSPYSTDSPLTYNTYYIDLEMLINDGLLNSRDFKGIEFSKTAQRVDYGKLYAHRDEILFKAFKRDKKLEPLFFECRKKEEFLDYAFFKVLKTRNNNKAWYDWKLEDRFYAADEKAKIIKENKKLIDFHIWTQYVFLKQRNLLHEYAKKKKINIIGDIPYFLSYDSLSMYCHPELFEIDKRNQITLVSGFPPDEFSKEGQKWGNPLYDWNYMKQDNYKWRNNRINLSLNVFDKIKLSHFRGFYQVYAIPFRAANAKKGTWIDGPKKDFFKDKFNLPLIASTLGKYDENFSNFIKNIVFPVLKTTILGFVPGNINDIGYCLPTDLTENTYAYFGNHDNMTLYGFISSLDKEQYKTFIKVVKKQAELLDVSFNDIESNNKKYIANIIIELLMNSKSNHVTLQFQDLLLLGNEARINIPGKIDSNNWTYRMLSNDIDSYLVNHFKEINIKFNRYNRDI